MDTMKFMISKLILFIALFFVGFLGYSQVSTTNYIAKNQGSKNWLNPYSYGQTAYQVDRSVNTYQMFYNGKYIDVYYYYVYFYNQSYNKVNSKWIRVGTYIPSYTIVIDGIIIGPNWMLVTGEYYYATYWSVYPNSNITITYTSPVPY